MHLIRILFPAACLSALISIGGVSVGIAQQPPDNSNTNIGTQTQNLLTPIIDTNDSIEIGKKIIFDASRSINPLDNTSLTYDWDLGDGTKAKGQEIVHTYSNVGDVTVKLFISNGQQSESITKTIFIYKKEFTLIVDNNTKLKELGPFLTEAHHKGVNVLTIAPKEKDTTPSNIKTDTYVQELLTRMDELKNISTIIFWTDGLTGLNILSSFSQRLRISNDFSLQNISIILVTDYDLGLFSRVSSRSFHVINPKQLVLVYKDIVGILYPLINSPSETDWYNQIRNNILSVFLTTESTQTNILNFFSSIINFGIEEGIPADILIFLLLIPLITMIITFLKQVIGLSTSGVYTPLILTLSLIVLGLPTGLIILGIVILGTAFFKIAIQHIRLLFIPRVAFIISMVSLLLLGLLIFGSWLNIPFGIENITSSAVLHIFPIIILAMMAEKFVSANIDYGLKKAIFIILEVVFVAIIAYLIANSQTVRIILFAYPELTFLFLLIELILGKFTGLRLLEYIRFRTLFTRTEHEE
jgi:PKD repeat protein